jgi:hypothetical protein
MATSCTSSCGSPSSAEQLVEWHDSSATDENESGTHCPLHIGAATDSDVYASVTREDDMLVTCEFDCGPPMPRKHMANKGTKRVLGVPCVILCHACHHTILGFET